MRISTDAQRLAHPQARFIPLSVMGSCDFFYYELPDSFIHLMKPQTETQLFAALNGLRMPDGRRQVMSLWLAIAFSHPNLSKEKLMALARQFNLSFREHLLASIGLNRSDNLEFVLAQESYSKQIAESACELFTSASEHNCFRMLRYWESTLPDKLQEMIAHDAFFSYRCAASNGHLEVLRYLESKAPTKLLEMIAANDFYAFGAAAANGHLDVLRYLESRAPTKLEEMIAANDFFAFTLAASNGYLEVLHYLESKAPAKSQEMVVADRFYALNWVTKDGDLETLRYLLSKIPNKIHQIINYDNFAFFRNAVSHQHSDMAHYLLNLDVASLFAYAEMHQLEFGAYIKAYLTEKLTNLRSCKQAYEATNLNAVFDVKGNEEGDLFFYYARQLIRRNEPGLREDLVLLLSIPGVKDRAHRSIRGDQENELLRLALSVNNRMAAELLLGLPAVRELAVRNNYYREEQRGALDLSQLAQDRESSMTSLSQGEQQRLVGVLNRYQPLLKAAGVSECMSDLRNELVCRYKAKPATIEVIDAKGVKSRVVLPLEWSSFKALNLAEPYYTKALQSYYQHTEHSAWRYLSRPNPWMHKHASYVYVNEQNHQEKWSTFEEYQPLISVLYLAARDPLTPATDGYILESRFTHFIEELAFIGRAHNWDESKEKKDEQGKILLDKQGLPIREEYDNLEGDRPSCYSGVKRRLFQSVQGHPLLVFLTKEVIHQEANDFIRTFFKSAITEQNRKAVKTALDKSIVGDDLTDDDWKALKQVDVPKKNQDELITLFSKKYGSQFSQDLSFNAYIQQLFSFRKAKDVHLLNFGHLHLDSFLAPTVQETQNVRLFTSRDAATSQVQQENRLSGLY